MLVGQTNWRLTIYLLSIIIGDMSGLNKNWLIGIAVVVIIIVGLGYFMFFRGGNKAAGEPTPTPAETVVESTPTAVPTIAKKDIKIRVLNGSGVVGEAGRVKAMLEKAGFKVDSTDNADNYNYKDTEIKAKANVSSQTIDELKNILNADYIIVTKELGEDEEEHVVITVGVRKNALTGVNKPSPTSAQGNGATPSPTAQKSLTSMTITPTPTP